MAKMKKVNPKAVFKFEIMAKVQEALVEQGMTVTSGEDYGMTKGTLVVNGGAFDLQIKPIVPKAGIDRYEQLEEEEEEEESPIVESTETEVLSQ